MTTTRKGVFFTVIMVLFLFALSIAIVKWSQGVQAHEYRVSRHVYLDSVITVSQVMGDQRIKTFSEIIARNSVYILANYTSFQEHKIKQSNVCDDNDNQKTCYVRPVLQAMIVNGTVDGSYFKDGNEFQYNDAEMMYTFQYFNQTLSELCNAIAWHCEISQPYNVKIVQVSPWDIEFNFTVDKTIKDPGNRYSIETQPVEIVFNVSIIGIPDPLTTWLMRESISPPDTSADKMRLIYKSNEPGYDDGIDSVWLGYDDTFDRYQSKGFVYGLLTNNGAMDASVAWKYIFSGKNIDVPDDYEKFGGLILENVKYTTESPVDRTWYHTYGEGSDCEVHCIVDYTEGTGSENDCVVDCFETTVYHNIDSGSSYNTGTGCSTEADPVDECDEMFRLTYMSGADSGDKHRIYNVYPIPYVKLEGSVEDLNFGTPFQEFTADYDINNLYNAKTYYPEHDNGAVLLNSENDVNITDDFYPEYSCTGTEDKCPKLMKVYDNLTTNDVVIYNIERLRDMAVCGFFVASERAPSFFQRMITEGDRFDSVRGIESFAVGKWALKDYSQVDYEYHYCQRIEPYASCVPYPQYMVKGMPGCKSKQMCQDTDAVDIGVGHFTIDRDSAELYDNMFDAIVCGADGFAPCTDD
jgi:hypothetical protein